ncbi:hypothetical protein [Rhizobium leguminosarum]
MDVLAKILAKNGLPPSFEVRPDDPTGFILPFAVDGIAMCEGIKRSRECRFTFVEGAEMQAIALQDEIDIVAMYAGMFWLLCRLASSAAASGVFPAMDGGNVPEWRPDISRSLRLPRDLLEEGKPFDWQAESLTWQIHPERQMLFVAILSVLFRFVTYHELGHIWNDHGLRRKGRAGVCVDAVGSGRPDAERSIASQAREIIADSFALNRTIQVLDRELQLKADLEMTKILRQKLLPTREAVAEFVLTLVFLYFRVSDLWNWVQEARDTLTHPPSPFRAKALAAALHEHRHLDISQASADLAVRKAVVGGEALVSVILSIYPNPNWMSSISGPGDDAHFRRIYDEIPRWHGPLSNA